MMAASPGPRSTSPSIRLLLDGSTDLAHLLRRRISLGRANWPPIWMLCMLPGGSPMSSAR